jgi:hypothetical protein
MAIKFTQVVDVANQRITSLGSPTLPTDAAHKQYVDNVAMGLNWKQAARAASTGDVTLASPGATMDGVTLANGDRVLLLHQADAKQNGIYVFNGATSALTRATDSDSSAEMAPGSALSVAEGTVNGDRTYILVTDGPITLDTTPLTFSLMNGGSGPSYTAGNGISLTGGLIAVSPATGGGLIANGAGLSIDASMVVKKFATNVGDGAATNYVINHNLNTLDVIAEVYTNGGTYDTVYCEVKRQDVNNLVLTFGTAPASAQYRVVVHG